MNPFTEDHLTALRDLTQVWQGTKFSLIGAAGLTCQMEHFYRQTADLDLAVAVSLDSLPATFEGLPGWRHRAGLEYRWESPAGVKVDIIPAGPDHVAAGHVTWRNGHTMSLVGIDHAFSNVHALQLAPDLTVNVATVPVIALLKVVAYEEHPAQRERDLGDIAHILAYHVPDNDPRRYSDEVFEAGLRGEEVSGFLLGRDLARLVNQQERAALDAFLARVERETDGGVAQAIMARQHPWGGEPDQLLASTRALRRGLEEGQPT